MFHFGDYQYVPLHRFPLSHPLITLLIGKSRTAVAGRSPDQRRWTREAVQQQGREMRITAWAALEGSVWVSTGSNVY